VIRAHALVKSYGGRRILDAVEVEVAAGEILALLGPNGAGKTTTVEILEGYRQADAGTIEVLGQDPWQAGRELRARVGVMLQNGGIDPRVTPREAIQLYGRFHAAPRGVDELLDLVGLWDVERTRYRRLSGGERQRVGLALALVGRPDVLFLDEPTAGMDPAARAATRAVLSQLRDEGAAILLTTHDLVDVERVADRVSILNHGRIVASGTPAEVGGGGDRGLEVSFDRAIDPAALGRAIAGRWPIAAVGVDARDASAILIHGVEPTPELVASVAAWAAVEGVLVSELRTGGSGLEARYLELTGDREVSG